PPPRRGEACLALSRPYNRADGGRAWTVRLLPARQDRPRCHQRLLALRTVPDGCSVPPVPAAAGAALRGVRSVAQGGRGIRARQASPQHAPYFSVMPAAIRASSTTTAPASAARSTAQLAALRVFR